MRVDFSAEKIYNKAGQKANKKLWRSELRYSRQNTRPKRDGPVFPPK
jgi:hypothetical protein